MAIAGAIGCRACTCKAKEKERELGGGKAPQDEFVYVYAFTLLIFLLAGDTCLAVFVVALRFFLGERGGRKKKTKRHIRICPQRFLKVKAHLFPFFLHKRTLI